MLEQIYILPVLLFSVIIHEVAHGWMALRLGDPTARDRGRLTLNPIPHIDPIGSVLIPVMSLVATGHVFIAWAKPVPVDRSHFANLRRDDILVSVVGPLSNLVLALSCTLAFILVSALAPNEPAGASWEVSRFLLKMFYGGISLNIILAVFNLLPIPPLDGSHIAASLMPPAIAARYQRIGFLGIFVILLLMRWAPFATGFWHVITALSSPLTALAQRFSAG
jgi:Zn-dependent protease